MQSSFRKQAGWQPPLPLVTCRAFHQAAWRTARRTLTRSGPPFIRAVREQAWWWCPGVVPRRGPRPGRPGGRGRGGRRRGPWRRVLSPTCHIQDLTLPSGSAPSGSRSGCACALARNSTLNANTQAALQRCCQRSNGRGEKKHRHTHTRTHAEPVQCARNAHTPAMSAMSHRNSAGSAQAAYRPGPDTSRNSL
jgi:hypothetical protein